MELYLNGKKADTPANFKINMTYQILDVNQPQTKINNYSKSITLQGTTNNNNIFGHIFRFDSYTTSPIGYVFDPNKKINFVVTSNGAIIDSGYAKMDKININKNIPEYVLTLYGNIGQFFYNLRYKNGIEKTLNDLYFGLCKYGNASLSEQEENTLTLFEYNKFYIQQAWDTIKLKETDNQSWNNISDTNIYKFMCPVPCYQGFYDNFDSDTVMYKYSSIPNAVKTLKTEIYDLKKNGSSEIIEEIYSPKADWAIVKLDRECSQIEMKDMRSHYTPFAIRLQAIYNAIKNPYNNGGFTVNDDNINDVEKLYINEGYVMMSRFAWDDIKDTINSAQQLIFSDMFVYKDVPAITPQSTSVDDYIDPNISIYVLPQIIFNRPVNNYKSGAWIYGGQETSSWQRKTANACAAQSLQYFWTEVLDNNNTVINRSDIYVYSDKDVDDEGKPFYLYNVYGTNGGKQYSGLNTNMLGLDPVAVKAFLDKHNLKLIEQNLTPQQKIDYEGYTTTNENLGVNINRTYINAGYVVSDDNTKFTGVPIKMDVKANDVEVRVKVNSDVFSFSWSALPSNNGWPYANGINFETRVWDINNDYRIYTKINEQQTIKYGSVNYNRTIESTPADNYIGALESKSSIYDGTINEGELHLVNKYAILGKSNSPYDYLLSIAKMFNWKFEMNNYTNTVYIYSNNNYYKNDVIDISDKVDYNTININPTYTSTSSHIFGLTPLDTYSNSLFKKVSNDSFGYSKIISGYEFNSEDDDVLKDCIFRCTDTYKQSSVYFNEETDNWVTPVMGKYADVTMFALLEDISKTKNERRWGRLRQDPTTSQLIQDGYNRLCFFDNEFNAVDTSNTLIFFNGFAGNINITDNFNAITQLNDNNCYIYSKNAISGIVNVDLGTVGQFMVQYNNMPSFGNYFNYNNERYYGTFKSDNNKNIFDLVWKRYAVDIYDVNNKIVKVKVKIQETPNNLLKRFYTFGGAIWTCTSVIDYNVDDTFVTLELLQVQNINNYIGLQIM